MHPHFAFVANPTDVHVPPKAIREIVFSIISILRNLWEKKTLFFLKVYYKFCSSVIQVSCGGTHSVALTRDGRIFSVCILNTLSRQCCDKKTDI